jgi:Kdo2-lipid IVA lauroyltransferase/acyltransferase
MIYFFEYITALVLIAFAKILPVTISSWIACRFADLACILLAKRRKIAFENIDRAVRAAGKVMTDKEKERLVRAAFQNAALSMMELFIVEKTARTAVDHFKLSGQEHLERALAQGKGAIISVSHLGSWEYLAFFPLLTRQKWSVIVKDIKNPYLDKLITRMRKITTVTPIPKTNSIKPVLRELKKGHAVAILIDQWAGDEGIWINFLGTATSTTSIPARLAKSTGAALVPAYCLRKSAGNYEIHIEEPLIWNPESVDWESFITNKLNAALERQIRAHAEQWLWGHRRWKDKPNTIRTVS